MNTMTRELWGEDSRQEVNGPMTDAYNLLLAPPKSDVSGGKSSQIAYAEKKKPLARRLRGESR